MSFKRHVVKTPVGPVILIEAEGKLAGVIYESAWPKFQKRFAACEDAETPLLRETKRQLTEYFRGARKTFDLPLKLSGTAFQHKVWSALANIPFGKTRTYKEQAVSVASPNAVRAVGQTNGANPICIVLPCHRVIGANGKLTGYAGGLPVKEFLLKLERR